MTGARVALPFTLNTARSESGRWASQYQLCVMTNANWLSAEAVNSSDAPGSVAADYRLDIYDPQGNFLARTTGVAAARMAVDTFRNVYTLNYETIAGAPRIEPSLSQWSPSTPAGCPTPPAG